jgi:Amt family ammonium transporter
MIDTGDTAWILMSTALVMLMLPGLALFYGGLVRANNVLSTIMHSFFGLAIVTVVWVVVGFSLAFGDSLGGAGIVGDPLQYIFFQGVGMEPAEGSTIPFVLFATFQMMFAAITPALISGAFAERKRFAAFVVFTVAWSLLIYSPLAHMVWGGGILGELGALDFAGGTVVHIASGVSALVVALVMGRRMRGHHVEPHDVPMTVLGAGLLWFGWFGFNAGSALGANGLAAQALMVTTVSAAAGVLTWVGASYLTNRKVCFGVTLLRERLSIDDSLDVFAVHGVGGMWGAVGTGIFAVAAVGGTAGLIDGNAEQLVIQLIATVFTVAFAAIGTFIIIKVIDLAIGLRVRAEEEEAGLDVAVHGETAYVPWAGTADGRSAASASPQATPAPTATEAEPA